MKKFTNPEFIKRFDELIAEGQEIYWNPEKDEPFREQSPVRFTQWATSCLNLLDKLSVSTNRFAQEFERYSVVQNNNLNVGLPLGVLKAARDEYTRGLAIDYHLSVSASVFGDIVTEASYLLEKGYLRAAAILARAGLEEALRSRARAIPLEISTKIKLPDLLKKLEQHEVLHEFDRKRIEAHVEIGNAAAHSDEFKYAKEDVEKLIHEAEDTVANYLGRR
jgi:Domain of unknown function (DUF4145)